VVSAERTANVVRTASAQLRRTVAVVLLPNQVANVVLTACVQLIQTADATHLALTPRKAQFAETTASVEPHANVRTCACVMVLPSSERTHLTFRPPLGSMDSRPSSSAITKENMSSCSSTPLTSPSYAPPRSYSSQTEHMSSEASTARSLEHQLTLNSLTWNTPRKTERREVSVRWTSP